MYLLKYWRETRIVFGLSLAAIVIALILILKTQIGPSSQHPSFGQLAWILPSALAVQTYPVCFVAWLLGSHGVGRDLGEGNGSYLFSRPRSRAFFVWRDWGFGSAQLLVIAGLLNAVIGVLIFKFLVAAGDPLHGSIVLQGGPVTLAFIIWLNIVAAFLLAVLVFSITYFFTVLVKHSKGVMVAAGVLLGYIILEMVVEHYWPGVDLPPVVPSQFDVHSKIPGLLDHLAVFLVIRAGIILLFPFARATVA